MNPKRAETRITLSDGVEYTLVFDTNAVAAFEEERGINPLSIVVDENGDPKFDEDQPVRISDMPKVADLRALIWAGLQRKHSAKFTSPLKVGELFDFSGMSSYLAPVLVGLLGYYGVDAEAAAASPTDAEPAQGEAPAASPESASPSPTGTPSSSPPSSAG